MFHKSVDFSYLPQERVKVIEAELTRCIAQRFNRVGMNFNEQAINPNSCACSCKREQSDSRLAALLEFRNRKAEK